MDMKTLGKMLNLYAMSCLGSDLLFQLSFEQVESNMRDFSFDDLALSLWALHSRHIDVSNLITKHRLLEDKLSAIANPSPVALAKLQSVLISLDIAPALSETLSKRISPVVYSK